MRVRISVLGLLPVGLATAFVATFLVACGGGGGGSTLPPLSDNDLIIRSTQQGSSTTAQAVNRVRRALRGIGGTLGQRSRGRQSGQCPRVVNLDYQGDYFDGSTLYFDEVVATLDYGNGCTDEFGDYGRGVITVRMTNAVIDLEAVLSGSFEFGSDYTFETAEISGQNFALDPDMRPVSGFIRLEPDLENEQISLEFDLTTRYSSSCLERVRFNGIVATDSFVNWLLDDTVYTIRGEGVYFSPLTGEVAFVAQYTDAESNDCDYPLVGEEVLSFRGNTVRITYNTSQQCGLATLTINGGNPITINLNNLAGITPCR